MPINNTKNDSMISSFAGVGTIAGGAIGYSATNKHYYKIADKTVKAFSGTLNKPDKFLRKNDELLTRAANSTKGFFGKINKLIGENTTDSWAQKVEKGASDVLNTYRTKASEAIKKANLTGEALENGIQELTNKNIAKDIQKSIKNVSANKTIAVVLGCAVIGTLLFNGIAKILKKPNKLNAENQNQNQKARSVNKNKKLK